MLLGFQFFYNSSTISSSLQTTSIVQFLELTRPFLWIKIVYFLLSTPFVSNSFWLHHSAATCFWIYISGFVPDFSRNPSKSPEIFYDPRKQLIGWRNAWWGTLVSSPLTSIIRLNVPNQPPKKLQAREHKRFRQESMLRRTCWCFVRLEKRTQGSTSACTEDDRGSFGLSPCYQLVGNPIGKPFPPWSCWLLTRLIKTVQNPKKL